MGQTMKLLNRTSRYYLLFSLVIFTIIGLVLFFALRFTLDHATDDSLEHTRPALQREFGHLDSLRPTMYIMDEIIELRPIPTVTGRETYRDTTIMIEEDDGEVEAEPFRKYTYDELVHGRPYRVSILLSTVENEDLIGTLLLVVLGGLVLILLSINLLNRYLSKVLWQPFYRTLGQIKTFSVQQNIAPAFAPSKTTEFDELNRGLESMTRQLLEDYDSLRRFTENASHELQTPLAVIRNQIDLLLQGEARSETDYATLQRLSEAVSKLGKLNQTLLLLARIERGQTAAAEWVDLKPLVERKLAQLATSLERKNIQVQTELASASVHLPPQLADVLLNNLLSNAVRHNVEGGSLEVRLSPHELTVANTGRAPRVSPERLFERFHKESTAPESLGLGLAIVREICDKHKYTLAYTYDEGWHRLRVGFGTSPMGEDEKSAPKEQSMER